MDAQFTLNGISFEWNRRKATANRQEHGVDFELACESFFDPFVCYLDSQMIDGEERETIVGLSLNWHLLLVVYVMRENTIRLISARMATKAEREQYEDQ
jgi:uncharacterized protein